MIKEPWKKESVYLHNTKYLPVEWVRQFCGNSLRRNEKEMEEFMAQIEENGFFHPLWMEVGRYNRKIKLGEGNHRLETAIRMGCEFVPVIVGLQNNAYQGGGYEPYDYPFLLEGIEGIERGLMHPDKVFAAYNLIQLT